MGVRVQIRLAGFFVLVALAATSRLGRASTDACPGNPNALGTSRVLTISPDEFKGIGSMQYKQTLPLNDHVRLPGLFPSHSDSGVARASAL